MDDENLDPIQNPEDNPLTSLPTNVNTGYVNGSDMLLSIGGKCVGHCTSHKMAYSSDTKEHAFKAPEDESSAIALFKESTVTGLSIQIDFEGLAHNEETENSAGMLRMAWRAAQPIEVKCFRRGQKSAPYLVGYFIIASFNEDYPAQDDTTFSGQLKNCGAPSTFTA